MDKQDLGEHQTTNDKKRQAKIRLHKITADIKPDAAAEKPHRRIKGR